MHTHTQPVRLDSDQPKERLVKRGARTVFGVLRCAVNQTRRVPGVLSQAVTDVREAWVESFDPKG